MIGTRASSRPDWAREGQTWPNRAASRFLRAGRILWHVQRMGAAEAPALLLLHGTGAATHSFRDLMPRLARSFHVLAVDLPGHGFTDARGTEVLTLPGMARALRSLLDHLEIAPVAAAGHSAGAAVAIRMAQTTDFSPAHLFGFNAALEPIQGNALFQPMARLLFLNPLTPRVVAWRAGFGDLGRTLLSATGSRIDAAGLAGYNLLFSNRAHVRGALGMMAHWDLAPLQRELPALTVPLTLIAAEDDPMVPAAVSRKAAARAGAGDYVGIPHGGHLLHETDIEPIARLIEERCGAASARAPLDARSA